jgi:hypothetical protein
MELERKEKDNEMKIKAVEEITKHIITSGKNVTWIRNLLIGA